MRVPRLRQRRRDAAALDGGVAHLDQLRRELFEVGGRLADARTFLASRAEEVRRLETDVALLRGELARVAGERDQAISDTARYRSRWLDGEANRERAQAEADHYARMLRTFNHAVTAPDSDPLQLAAGQ